MRRSDLFLACAVLASVAVAPRDANACGGCFIPPQSESTQVTGHRMILSLSQDQTTLYDQIQYVGDPEEFAWVLPIRGQVGVALSSDALFATLEALTSIQIESPPISCSPCGDSLNSGGSGGLLGEVEEEPAVEIIAQEVVGPYETVQLAAEDPQALIDWLEGHGYAIPDEIQPIIDDYVNDGFGFLALRLVPGTGIDSMKPVAVTTPGAGPILPLKMVAAGTGAITPINLWVIGEGRYEAENFPRFLIRSDDLVWDWDQQRSNYSEVKAQGFADTDGRGWLTQAADPLDPYAFDPLRILAERDPVGSGYADNDGQNATLNAEADIERLLAGIDPASAWVTRMTAELPRDALGEDLVLRASAYQSSVERWFEVEKTVGTPPECPACADGEGETEDGAETDDPYVVERDSSCRASAGNSRWSAIVAGALAGAACWLALRRRRGSRS